MKIESYYACISFRSEYSSFQKEFIEKTRDKLMNEIKEYLKEYKISNVKKIGNGLYFNLDKKQYAPKKCALFIEYQTRTIPDLKEYREFIL